MTVEKLDYRENYIGNGVTLVFPFNVNYYQDSSIEVYVDREKQSDGYVIDKVNNPVEYDISESISIIFDTPPVDGAEVNIVRKTPNLQPLDFVNGAKLRAETLERGFDLIVMMLQELLGNIGNSLRLDHFSGDGSLLIIKFNAEERADTVLVFDENGEITVVPIDGFPKGDKGDKGDRGAPTDPSSVGLIELADGTANTVLGFDNLGKPAFISQSVGSITATAGVTSLDGYLECNGAAISRTIYADLFAVCSTIYGIGDGSTTFNIPDLRGEFIRGFDNGRSVDPVRVHGSFQGDLVKDHTHDDYNWVFELDMTSGVELRRAISITRDSTTGPIAGAAGVENRPRNVALIYCIKY